LIYEYAASLIRHRLPIKHKKMSNKNLALEKTYDIGKMAEVKQMAVILKDYIVDQSLYTLIAGKNYVNVEGWQVAGGLMGMAAKIVKVENLSSGTEKKWRADVEIVRIKDGVSVGYGSAICSNLEAKKKSFDEYAICSMAQTRAIGKAYRNMIGWVIKLAGYEAAPAEEMTKVGQDATPGSKATQTAKQGVKITPGKPATADSSAKEKLFTLAREYGAVAGKETKVIEASLKMKINWVKCTEANLQKIYTEFLAKTVK